MSTKIYNAYRLEKNVKLWDLVRDIQAIASWKAYKVLDEQLDRLTNSISKSSEAYTEKSAKIQSNWNNKLSSDHLDIMTRHSLADRRMEEEYKESHAGGFRSGFDYDASLTFREYRGRLYMQIYADGPMRGIFRRWTRRPYAVDYHYQNRADRAPGITNKNWVEREAVWEALYNCESIQKSHLTLEVMSLWHFNTWLYRSRSNFMKPIHAAMKAKEKDAAI